MNQKIKKMKMNRKKKMRIMGRMLTKMKKKKKMRK